MPTNPPLANPSMLKEAEGAAENLVASAADALPGPIDQTWQDLFMAHWRVTPEALRPLVPAGLDIEEYDGSAWVSAVSMRALKPDILGVPTPGADQYAELNLRTYVRAAGCSGVYFFSIDFPTEVSYWLAQHIAGINACEADVTYTERDPAGVFTFQSRRKGDGPPAVYAARCRATGTPAEAATGSIDEFLTDRASQFAVSKDGSIHRLDLRHPAWKIQQAEITLSDDTALRATGISISGAPALCHYMAEMMGTAWFQKPVSPAAPAPGGVKTLADCAREADAAVAAVAGDPEARYRIRVAFYEKYGYLHEPPGYGASELAFLRWEADRGALTPGTGSAWWQAVNAGLIRDAEEARLMFEAGLDGPGRTLGARFWLEYLKSPSPVSWYRAHNSSIASGYLANESLARREEEGEQVFLNMVLYRVLYAQSMVDPAAMASNAGLFARAEHAVESVVANPALLSVQMLVDVPQLYPAHYPLSKEELKDVLGKAKGTAEDVGIVFDDDIVLPRAQELYATAAKILDLAALVSLIRAGKPDYPA